MTITQEASRVRRPLSLKIFGIVAGLLSLMILVTLMSSISLRRVGQQLDFLVKFYIQVDQKMGDLRSYGLSELILIERILQNRPTLSWDAAKAEADKRQKEVGECTFETLRPANASIRKAFVNPADSQAVRFELLKRCAADKLARVEQLVDTALASEFVRQDAEKVARLATIRQALKDVQPARARMHATFQQYLEQLATRDPRAIALVRSELEENRSTLGRKISDITNQVHEGTRLSGATAYDLEQRVQWMSWAITLVACLLGLIVATILTKSLVSPLRELLSGTRAIEEGNLDIQIKVSTSDELERLGDSFNHMVRELRQKEEIKTMFGKYVDPRVVQGLLDRSTIGNDGDRRRMTVFFSDLEDFTKISEQMTPGSVVRLLNHYFTVVAEPIRASNGIIDKYIGDSVMAFWGPPFTQETDHAVLACYAVLDQQARIPQFQAALPDILGVRTGVPKINVRMALATGDVTIGSIGSEDAKSYTVIGDTVNLASRLESVNKLFGTNIIISENTRTLAGDAIETRELDNIRVAGKLEPIRIYELLARKGQAAPRMMELRDSFEQALGFYRQQQWDEAQAALNRCLQINAHDGPSLVLQKRIGQFRNTPPAVDWDGSWTMVSK
jgi:adenylate cyclase